MYAYVHNNPMTRFDLYGLMCVILPIENKSDTLDPETAFQEIINEIIYEFHRTWDKGFVEEKWEAISKNIEVTLYTAAMPGGNYLPPIKNKLTDLANKIFRKLGYEAIPALKKPLQMESEAIKEITKLKDGSLTTAKTTSDIYKSMRKVDYSDITKKPLQSKCHLQMQIDTTSIGQKEHQNSPLLTHFTNGIHQMVTLNKLRHMISLETGIDNTI